MYKEKPNLKENLRNAEIEPLRKEEKVACDLSEEESEQSTTDSRDYSTRLTCKTIFPQIIAAVAVSCVSFIVGYISSYTSPAESSLEAHFKISKEKFSWISGLLPMGAIFGGFLGGPLIEHWGRKRTLILTDIMFFLAWIVTYFAANPYYLFVSRGIAGCSMGIASLIFPVYLGETIQPEVRGILGLLPTAFGNVGMLVCCACGFLLDWKGLAGVGTLLPIPFLAIFSWIIPETPQWFISKGRIRESKEALKWLRGNSLETDKEFQALESNQNKNKEVKANVRDLLTRKNLKPLMIVLGLMLFQQLSGINAIIYYTKSIFERTGSHMDSLTSTTIVIAVNFFSTFIATLLVDALGRKILLYISATLMTITMIILGAYFYMVNVLQQVDTSAYGWIPLASCVVYVLGFSLGFGPVPWLMLGELLPSKIRGIGGCAATGFNFLCAFIVTKSFFSISELIGEHGVFWLFSVFLVLSLVFTVLFVPETKGQSLEEIENKLLTVPTPKNSNVTKLEAIP